MLFLATQLDTHTNSMECSPNSLWCCENWIFHALHFSSLCKQHEKEQRVKNGILPRRLVAAKTSLIWIFKVSNLKIHTEQSVSKIFFHDIVHYHIKYIEIDAFHVYTKFTQQENQWQNCVSHYSYGKRKGSKTPKMQPLSQFLRLKKSRPLCWWTLFSLFEKELHIGIANCWVIELLFCTVW